jgi:hypothetical protein
VNFWGDAGVDFSHKNVHIPVFFINLSLSFSEHQVGKGYGGAKYLLSLGITDSALEGLLLIDCSTRSVLFLVYLTYILATALVLLCSISHSLSRR